MLITKKARDLREGESVAVDGLPNMVQIDLITVRADRLIITLAGGVGDFRVSPDTDVVVLAARETSPVHRRTNA
jgi:hypothetical protein